MSARLASLRIAGALLLSAVLAAALAACAAAPAAPGCEDPADVTHTQMLGTWRAEVRGEPPATLVLQQHPTYAEGFSGWVERGGVRALVAGDVDQGDFTLEESRDGQRISATWLGDVMPGSCGREVQGTWQAEGDALAKPFVLKKM